MSTINIAVDGCNCQQVQLGFRGENEATDVVFDIAPLVEEFGPGITVLLAKRSSDTAPYPVNLQADGTTVTWTVTSSDTYAAGYGQCQLMYYIGDQLAKSYVWQTYVREDISGQSGTAPDNYQNWVDTLTALGATTLQNAEDAEAAQTAAETAQGLAEDAEDDAVDAKDLAVSAKNDAVQAKNDAVQAKLDAQAALSTLQSASATANTLPEGSQATASYNNGVFTFGIPKGDTGATGATGATGNGIASVAKTGTAGLVDTYTITYTNGTTTTFTVTNGAKGDTGATGATGNGIASVAKTGTAGLVDTYTITYTNGTTTTFTVTNGANGEITASSIADTFSSSTAYAAGDYVIYSGQLYQFTAAHAAGAWSGSDASAVQLVEKVSQLSSAISNLDFEVEVNKTTEFATAQLMDESTYTHGAVLDDGTVSTSGAWNGYDTSDFIPVEAGKTYSIYFADANGKISTPNRTIYLICNTNKEPVSHNNIGSPTNAVVELTMTANGYLRVCSATSKFHPYMMVVQGTTLGAYASYKKQFVTGINFNQAQEVEIDGIANKDKTLSINKSGDLLTIENTFGSNTLRRTMLLHDTGRNKAVNFDNVYIVNNGVATKIKDSTDDIAPQRLGIYNNNVQVDWTVGANHGWPGLRIPSSDHSLTTADIGSVWTDGTTQYVLYRVHDEYAVFLFPCTKTSYELYFKIDMPVSALTHVSGATHTESIPITNAVQGQVYPSTSNNVFVSIDGKKITADGNYKGKTLVINERTSILDYSDMVVWQKSHIGNDSINNISGYITIFNNYVVTENSVLVEQSIRKANMCEIKNSGVLQATSLEQNNGTVYAYVNNVTSGTFDSSALVDMNNYSTGTIIDTSNITGTNIPDRIVEYHDVSGTVDYGFTMGFIPDLADSANSKRDDNANFFDIRASKKIYPYCFYQIPKSTGTYYIGIGYRVYFPTSAKENKTLVRIGDTLYVFADRIGNTSFWQIEIPDEFAGCSITSVYENGLTKWNSIVDGSGLSMRCASGHGSAVYKISK